MSRPKGLKKTGGRRTGTPNKRSLLLSDRLEVLSIDVLATLAATLPQLKPEARAKVLLELMTYLYPKRKAADMPAPESESNQSKIIRWVMADNINLDEWYDKPYTSGTSVKP